MFLKLHVFLPNTLIVLTTEWLLPINYVFFFIDLIFQSLMLMILFLITLFKVACFPAYSGGSRILKRGFQYAI